MLPKDLQLLKDLCSIERHYKEEYKVVSFILNFCHKELSDVNLNFETDQVGNLFITKNTTDPSGYPLVVAHMDCVQNFSSKREFLIHKNTLYARYIINNKQAGLSADDSCGMWVALKLLKEVPDVKILFTVQEESGGFGAEAACENYAFFSDVRYMLQADRRGSSNLIVHTNGIDVTSKEFQKDINSITKRYNYSPAFGTFTDVGILTEHTGISGCNISCGYRNEHTEKEFVNLVDLQRCYEYIKNIIVHLSKTDKVYKIKVQNYPYYKHFKDTFYDPENDYESLPCDKCKHWDCMNCNEWKNF